MDILEVNIRAVEMDLAVLGHHRLHDSRPRLFFDILKFISKRWDGPAGPGL